MERHLCNCAVIIVILVKCIHGQESEEDFCDNVRPEFSHVDGQPHVVPVLTNETKYIDISWSTDNILSGIRCADAFEVEFQQVGGGRLTWSSWSAMVTCAPTRNGTINVYHCKKFLNWRNCATRMRFRIIPHNSRNMIIKVRASPYEEVVVYCYLGSPSRVEVNKLSSGLYNKPLSPMERASRIYVAKSRDIRLRKLQESMERTRENRRIKNERIKEQQRRNEERIKQQRKERQKSTNAPPTSKVYSFTHHTTTPKPQSTAKTTIGQSFTYGLSEGTSTTARPFICEYSEWSSWSNCTQQCGSGIKSRERHLLSRDPIECLFTNQTKSCFGNTCNQTSESSGERAVLLPGKYAERRMKKGYEVRSNLKNFTDDSYTPLYCAKFEVLSATRSCLKNAEFRSLRKGSLVCSLCMKKSEENKSICKGDGEEQKLLGFRLMLETRCFGTWKKIKQEQECSCQVDYSFLFA